MSLFLNFPLEIVNKIFSTLDIKDYVFTSLVSKYFGSIQDIYLMQFLKDYLTNMGIFVENIISEQRLKDIYKSRDLHNKTCTSQDDSKQYVVGSNGKIYNLIGEKIVTNFDHDINNIIAISGNLNNNYVLLTNNGEAYTYEMDYFMGPELVYFGEYPLINIIQILATFDYFLFLSSKGQVYIKKNYSGREEYTRHINYLKDIVKICINGSHVYFLSGEGNVYEYNGEGNFYEYIDERIIKVEHFVNIKRIFNINALMTATLSKDNIVNVYVKNHDEIASTKFEGANKVKNYQGYFLILSNNNLYYSNLRFDKLLFETPTLLTTDVTDFYVKNNSICILTKENKIIIKTLRGNTPKTYTNNCKTYLLDHKLIFMNGNLYYINNDLIKIC
jgi:hypothetical protein